MHNEDTITMVAEMSAVDHALEATRLEKLWRKLGAINRRGYRVVGDDAWTCARVRQVGCWHDAQAGRSWDDIAVLWDFAGSTGARVAVSRHQKRLEDGWVAASDDETEYPADEELPVGAFGGGL